MYRKIQMLTKFSYAAIIGQPICIFISHFLFQTINIYFLNKGGIILFQLTKVLLLLSCFASDALAGLLPGGSAGGGGYQYNRPSGAGFGGPGGLSGDLGGGFRGRPNALYGAPGAGGDAGFGGRPSGTYGAPGFGGDAGYQGGGGGQGRDYGRVCSTISVFEQNFIGLQLKKKRDNVIFIVIYNI